jgi:hypothetical protein
VFELIRTDVKEIVGNYISKLLDVELGRFKPDVSNRHINPLFISFIE